MRFNLLIVIAFLLFFSATALATAPIVDFNWFVDGVKDVNTITSKNIIFDPKITSSPDANILRWQFDLDGNINYTSNPAGIVIPNFSITPDGNGMFNQFIDNFTRGNFTTAPIWTVTSGSGFDVGTNLRLNHSGGTGGAIKTDINFVTGNFNFSFDQNSTGFTNANASGIRLTKDGNTWLEISWVSLTGLFSLQNNDGTTIAQSVIPHNSPNTVYGLTLIKNGNDLNLFVNGISDINVSKNYDFNVDRIAIISNWGINGFSQSYDNFSFRDINASPIYNLDQNAVVIDIDKNENHSFTTTGTKNICLTVGNNDGNTSVCKLLKISGSAVLNFYDENTGLSLVPSTVTVNGIPKTLIGNTLTLDLNGLTTPTDFLIIASDINKSQRSWLLKDKNENSLIDLNLALLDTNKGKIIDFHFFYPNQITQLSNAILNLRRGPTFFSSIGQANAQGFISFFVNPDANYLLEVDANAKGIIDYNYRGTTLKVLVPKNETTDVNISPYRVSISGLASYDQNNLLVNTSFLIFQNTVNFYNIAISFSANSTSFFTRSYVVKTKGDLALYILQPYLIAQTELLTILKVKDIASGSTLPNILINSFSSVSSTSNTLIQSAQTDSSGQVLMNFIFNKDYFFDLYDVNENLLASQLRITVVLTGYTIQVTVNDTTISLPSVQSIDVNFGPIRNIVTANDLNQFIFDINLQGKNNSIKTIQVFIGQDDNYFFTQTFSGFPNGANFRFVLDSNSFPNTYARIKSQVLIKTNFQDENIVFSNFWSGVFPGKEGFTSIFTKGIGGFDNYVFPTILWFIAIIAIFYFLGSVSPGMSIGIVILVTGLFIAMLGGAPGFITYTIASPLGPPVLFSFILIILVGIAGYLLSNRTVS